MPSYDYSEQVGDALAQINVYRDRIGQPLLSELPSATRGDPAACLFYRALADCGVTGVYGDSISFSSSRQAALAAELWGTRAEGERVIPPVQMRKTISDFDHSKFAFYDNPELR